MAGGGGARWPSRNQLDKHVSREANRARETVFGSQLNEKLLRLLSEFNNRDSEKVQKRLDEIRGCLENTVEGSVNTLFGGSVAKHTYVDGLSDIDALLVLSDPGGEWDSPTKVLSKLKLLVKRSCAHLDVVKAGDLALTVKYRDGMEIQCLPALRQRNSLKIASAIDPAKWSDINPERFQSALSKANADLGGKLIPVIKLAKAVISSMPPPKQISGYHVEALSISAFKTYKDDLIPNKMLPHLFDSASRTVLAPIKDSTGQSVHVDDALGPANSASRQEISIAFERLSKKMRNATAAQDLNQWDEFFN